MDGRALTLLVLTSANFGITYATGILLARGLGIERYEDYAVAVAAVTMMSTLAELGTGKYAMRVLPQYVEAAEWGLALGYRVFAKRAILVVSGLLLVCVLLPDLLSGDPGGLTAMGMAVLFLPVMALVGYGAEVVQANHATVRAAVLSRVVVPGVTLLALVAWSHLVGELSARAGVALFGAGWVGGLVLCRVYLARTTAPQVAEAAPEMRVGEWLREMMPYLAFALLVVVLAKAGLVVLKIVADDRDASIFAAAMETGSFLYLIAKSTDKMFLPELSVVLERKDAAHLQRERMKRLRWVGAVCLVFLAGAVLLGRRVLGLFGPGFEEGHTSLVIVSAATAVWTLFSLAPSYLKYVDRKRLVVQGTAAAVVANLVLTWTLGARYGHVGASLAFALPISVLYGGFAIAAHRELERFVLSTRPSTHSLEQEDEEEFPF